MQEKLPIHDDLHSNQELITEKYCCPIFIANQLGVAFAQEQHLIGNSLNPPRIRSATLTFISHEGQVYGLTCRHVVETLEEYNSNYKATWWKKYNFELPEDNFHFFFPTLSSQVHINSCFFLAKKDNYTNRHPDVAIAKISKEKLKQIGREALPSSRLCDDVAHTKGNTCIATGYPEQNRVIKSSDTLAISVVRAIAPCSDVSEYSFTMQSEIENPSQEVNNLSGMSGGAVLWSTEDQWGLLGIIKEGKNINGDTSNTQAISQSPSIWVSGQTLTKALLISLITDIPASDEFLSDKTKVLYIPK